MRSSENSKKNFLTFGEVADNDEKIARYTGRFASDPDDLIGVDLALDFPLFGTLVAVVKGFQPPSSLARLYEFRKELHCGQVEARQVLISSHAEASRFFVTFLDNHDQHYRFRYSAPPDPNRFDSQVSMGVGCLFALQGIPVIYYGTEQGLHGAGDKDLFVREALWGKPDAFAINNPFYRAVQDIAQVRAAQPALRYGRLYFRQVAGEDGKSFALWAAAPGIIAFSRLLNESEVVVVANAFTDAPFTFFVLVDFGINPVGSQFDLLYSNQANAAAPGPVQQLEKVDIFDLSGNKSQGPVRAMKVTLQPMEIQILGQKA